MDPNRSLPDHIRRLGWSVKDRFIDILCSFGMISDPQTLKVSGVSADFRVTSSSERWRVQNAMGERETLEPLIEAIEEGDCFWDVGAAVGTYSCLALETGATVVAFEPHPVNRKRCKENIRLNGYEPDVRDVALSDSNSTFKMAPDDGVGAGMYQLSSDGAISVQAIRGDTVEAPDPEIIKIDVEGHEMEVLRGMGSKLKSVRLLLVECHPEFGVDTSEVENYLQNRNFTTNRVNTERDDTIFVFATQNNSYNIN